MDQTTIMIVDIDGVKYAAECPCINAMAGMTAEVGDCVGTVTHAIRIKRTSPEYALIKALGGILWVDVQRLSVPCWAASSEQ